MSFEKKAALRFPRRDGGEPTTPAASFPILISSLALSQPSLALSTKATTSSATLEYAYLAGGDEVVVISLGDATNYFVQTTVPLTDTGVSSFADLVIEGDYLIALYPGGGEVFDLSIPALPISRWERLSGHTRDTPL